MVPSFLPRRLSQLPRIRRGVTLEVAPHAKRGDRIGQPVRTFHHVVAVKIVAAEAAEPEGLAYERRMRDVERVVFHFKFAMTMPAVPGLHRDAAARVLAMTAYALLGGDHLASVGKARLVETNGGMPIERPFMTGVAIAVLHFSKSEVDGRVAPSEEKTSAGLDLLAHATGSGPVAVGTGELLVPYVHSSGSREVLLAGCQQGAPGRDRQAEPYPCPHPSPQHARRRRGPAPPVRTARHHVRREGDCRRSVILSITRALRLHGFPVN
jgi:hypothetical protein